jgi:hypothetical protein
LHTFFADQAHKINLKRKKVRRKRTFVEHAETSLFLYQQQTNADETEYVTEPDKFRTSMALPAAPSAGLVQ